MKSSVPHTPKPTNRSKSKETNVAKRADTNPIVEKAQKIVAESLSSEFTAVSNEIASDSMDLTAPLTDPEIPTVDSPEKVAISSEPQGQGSAASNKEAEGEGMDSLQSEIGKIRKLDAMMESSMAYAGVETGRLSDPEFWEKVVVLIVASFPVFLMGFYVLLLWLANDGWWSPDLPPT